MFPTEIWEKILQNTEATSLVRLRTVNSTWDAIIKKHLQESDAWYKQCKNDIPEKYWLTLLENSFSLTKLHRQTGEDERCNSKIWMTMYRAWIKWCNVQDYRVLNVDEFNPIPVHQSKERITCCAVLGELVAVGSSDGWIRIYNLCTSKLVFRVDQYEQVLDVKLCVQGKNHEKIVLIATSVFNKCRVWDVTYQKSLMFTSGDVICAGYGYYCTTLCSDKILVYNAATEGCFPTRIFINDLCNTKTVLNDCSGKAVNMKYVNMIINDYQLCCWSDNGLYCELDLREINPSGKFLYTPEVTHVGVPKHQKIRQYYLFNPYVAFCVTERGYLGISVHKSKWQLYNVYHFLEGAVSSILFYVRVLVIGLDSGDVCLFFVENELALRTIDFKSDKSKRIPVASEPIVSVNIMEISGDQRLLVATRNTIHHIKLDYTL